MNKSLFLKYSATLMIIATPWLGAYESGSTGSDGVFSPVSDVELVLPDNGIFNFSEVNIPAGVTVTFAKNADNTAVFILATGDILVDGIIDVSGGSPVAAVGPTPAESDRLPGIGGPGGFDGGIGGIRYQPLISGSWGIGPGGGEYSTDTCGGGGGGYGTAGGIGHPCSGAGGASWGTPDLVPLVGGAGGGGGGAHHITFMHGQGGAGGGGAILMAASNNITVNGSVIANGGSSPDQTIKQGGGGTGSGGAIRIIADSISGEGAISAVGGVAGTPAEPTTLSGVGGDGRIRLEATTLIRLSDTTPTYIYSQPQTAIFAAVPALRIATIGGVATPTFPTGDADVALGSVVNPVEVEIETANVPLGTTVTLDVTPYPGGSPSADGRINFISSGVIGSIASGVATVSAELPAGSNTLQARTTFTVVASLGDALSRYAMGERVQSVSLLASVEGNVTEFTTVSGKTFRYPSDQVGQLAAKG